MDGLVSLMETDRTVVVKVLVTRYREVLRDLKAAERDVARYTKTLDGIETTIRSFDADYPLEELRPRLEPSRAPGLKAGEAGRLALEFLREASEPVATADIVRYVVEQADLTLSRREWQGLSKTVTNALRRRQTSGIVVEAGRGPKGVPIYWALANRV